MLRVEISAERHLVPGIGFQRVFRDGGTRVIAGGIDRAIKGAGPCEHSKKQATSVKLYSAAPATGPGMYPKAKNLS